MRKITKQMVDAFYQQKNFKLGNTEVRDDAIYLHDNKIIELRYDGIWITTAGWITNTTLERLNGLNECHVTRKNGVLYLNSKEWDGKWIKL